MFKNIYSSLLLISIVALIDSEENIQTQKPSNDKVKLKVFYETLCPGSVRFITLQLRPVVQKLAAHLDVQLVPYGHARTWHNHGHHEFSCQHGAAECYGNKLHACVIDSIRNSTQATLFNACLMQNTVRKPNVGYDYRYALNWCGYENDFNVESIRHCMHSVRGFQLLKIHGDETKQQKIKYVPYLMVNGDQDLEGRAANNLIETVCNILHPMPTECF